MESPSTPDPTRTQHATASRQDELLTRLFEAVPAMIVIYDPALRAFQFNREFRRVLGWTEEDAAAGDLMSMVYPDPQVRAAAAEHMGSLAPGWREFPVTAKHGEIVPSAWVNLRLSDDSQVGIGLDLRDRKRAEESLRRSAERYRTLFTNMTEGFALGEAIVDESGAGCDVRLIEMNDAFERQSGLGRERAQGRPLREVLPNIEHSWIDTYCGVALGGPARRFESYNRDLDRHFSVYCFSPTRGQFAVLFTDVTERRRSEDAVAAALRTAEHERRRLAAVLEALPTAVAIADANGRVTDFNDAFVRMWGTSPGKTLAEHDGERRAGWPGTGAPVQPVESAVARVLATGALVPGDVVEIDKMDGSGPATIINSAAPIRDTSGEVVGAVVAEVDISAQRRAEEALQEADRRKDEFLATLAHELRNPLAPIRFALRLLDQAGDDPASAARSHQVIDRQVNQLIRLVDDLLDVSRITRNKIQLRKERVKLGALMHTAVEATEPHLRAAGQQLTVHIEAGECELDADAARLVQVFTNLLNNAVKFTPRGGQIYFSADQVGGHAVITVLDTGIGIPPENLPHIFDMFHQAESSLDRSVGGLGIGLTISKRLVEMHGGTLTVSSAGRNRGADFRIRIPVSRTAARSEGARPLVMPAAPASRPGLRVLIVDDNVDAADMLALLVGGEGHQTRSAHDGRTALEAAAAFRPDAALLDIGLPGLNGYQVAHELRRRHGDDIYLVAITGWGQEEDRRRAREAGFDCHITKPADPDAVTRLLAALSTGREQDLPRPWPTPLTRNDDFGRTAGPRERSADA